MKEYDVIVAGGGTAGVTAAIAAARGGAKTLIVERWGHLGGTAVFGIPFLGIYDGNNVRVNAGICSELVEKMRRENGSIGDAPGGHWKQERYAFSLTPFEPETYKYCAQEMVLEAGADILFHSFVSEAIMEDRRIRGLRVVNKSGGEEIGARVIIDCTGDADVARLAGASLQQKSACQNVSILFKAGGVDMERFLAAMEAGKGVGGWDSWHKRIVRGVKLGQSSPSTVHIAGHFLLKELGEITFTAISEVPGEVYLNATRTAGVDALDAWALSRAEMSERRHVQNVMNALVQEVPGFEKARLLTSSPVGIRESCNIVGLHTLTKEEVLSGAVPEDTVALGAYPIDIHDPLGGRTQFTFIQEGGHYGVPYRCLIPAEVDGMLVAGRCISASHEAQGTVRIMGCAMSQGEAAGTAAAMVALRGISPRELDAVALRNALRENGALVDAGGRA